MKRPSTKLRPAILLWRRQRLVWTHPTYLKFSSEKSHYLARTLYLPSFFRNLTSLSNYTLRLKPTNLIYPLNYSMLSNVAQAIRLWRFL